MTMPGTILLEVPPVASEITQYLPDAWKPIADTDIDGPASTPVKIDTERSLLGARATTRRVGADHLRGVGADAALSPSRGGPPADLARSGDPG